MSTIIAPILAFIAGAASLHVDPKDSKRTYTLLAVLLVVAVLGCLLGKGDRDEKLDDKKRISSLDSRVGSLISQNGQLIEKVGETKDGIDDVLTALRTNGQRVWR